MRNLLTRKRSSPILLRTPFNVIVDRRDSSATRQASLISQVFALDLPVALDIRVLKTFCAHDDPSTFSAFFGLQVYHLGLGTCSHDIPHRHLSIPDRFKLVFAIIIKHVESENLVLFKVVDHVNAPLKFGVQVVHHPFSFTDLRKLFRLFVLHEDLDNGVGFGESV